MSELAAWLGLVPPTMRQPVIFMLFNCTWTYVVGEITQNASQVDRLWTVLPTLYTGYYAFAPYFSWAQFAVQFGRLGQVTLILLSLTYHGYCRDMFKFATEDYRWAPIRKAMSRGQFRIFSLFFISISQNMVLFIFGLPAHSSLTETQNIPLGLSDYVPATLSLVFIALESVSDNQQQAYQTWKRTKAAKVEASYAWPGARLAFTEADRERGFITRGLWAWSRHPNFVCEQSFWITQTFVPILAAPNIFHLHALRSELQAPFKFLSFFISYPMLPAITVCSLFYSSTLLSEYLSAQKYPTYRAYQKRVGMFMPVETAFRALWFAVVGGKKELDADVYGDAGRIKKVQ